MTASIKDARRAKPKAMEAARLCVAVAGVGLTRVGDSYAVKILLAETAPAAAELPDSVDGVPVVYEVVGRIVPRER